MVSWKLCQLQAQDTQILIEVFYLAQMPKEAMETQIIGDLC